MTYDNSAVPDNTGPAVVKFNDVTSYAAAEKLNPNEDFPAGLCVGGGAYNNIIITRRCIGSVRTRAGRVTITIIIIIIIS